MEGLGERAGGFLAKFMKEPKNFLVFLGAPGIGKTYFCAALTEWAMSNFTSFRHFNENKFFEKVREGMDVYQGDYATILRHIIDHDLFIYDDLGSVGVNEWRKEITFTMLDERYNSGKPTIITSNLTKNQFETMYHERFTSRLFASENVIIEAYNLQDLRKKGM